MVTETTGSRQLGHRHDDGEMSTIRALSPIDCDCDRGGATVLLLFVVVVEVVLVVLDV
jgi:hypothetical protein